MENEVNDSGSPRKRKRGRPRKNKEVSKCLTSSQENNHKTQENCDSYEVLNSEATECADNSQRQTRRSGRKVKAPTRYMNYVIARDNTSEDVVNEVYECDACARTFLSKGSIYCHQYTCAAEKELACDLCQETLHSYKDLRTHQKTHRSYSCDFCKQEFGNISEFRVHSKWHSLQTLECNICHRRFLRIKALKEHMVQEHDQPMELYTCTMCQKTFALLDYLKEHQKTHEGEDGFTMEYIVKPLVKDTTKRNTCVQDKPGRKKHFVKKTLEHVEKTNKERDNEVVPLNLNQRMCSANDSVKRVKKQLKANKHVVVHVHVQPDEGEGQKIVTTCQQEQLTVEDTQQHKQQQETTTEAMFSLVGGQLPEGCVVVLTESEEAVNELEREYGTSTTTAIELIQQEHQKDNSVGNSTQEVADGGNKVTLTAVGSTYVSGGEEVQTIESQLKEQEDGPTSHQQLVVSEEVVDIEQHQQIHPSGQTAQVNHTDQTILQESHQIVEGKSQIILPGGQTIVVEQDDNLVPGQQIYLQQMQTFSEHEQVGGQQIIIQGEELVESGHSIILNNHENVVDGQQHTVLVQEGPDGQQHTVFVQEGPGGHHQHVLLQTTEDCVAIGNDEHHVIVQEAGDIVSNNQHVIMQSGDGTTLLLEGDCSVGDSIIVAAMQHV